MYRITQAKVEQTKCYPIHVPFFKSMSRVYMSEL